MGVPLVEVKTSASSSTENPALLWRFRCNSRASTAFAVRVNERRLFALLGDSNVGDPRPATSAWRMCRVRRAKSRHPHRRPRISPLLIPVVNAKQKSAWCLSPSAAIMKARASSWLSGRISGGSVRGGSASLQTFEGSSRQRTAAERAAERTACILLTVPGERPLTRLAV